MAIELFVVLLCSEPQSIQSDRPSIGPRAVVACRGGSGNLPHDLPRCRF